MPVEKLTRILGKQLQRRGFLGKVGAGAAGVTAAMLGLPREAGANAVPQSPVCCGLCDPGVPQGQACFGAFCTWSWECCHQANHTRYRCTEGYYRDGCPPPPGGACTAQWRCSSWRSVGGC